MSGGVDLDSISPKLLQCEPSLNLLLRPWHYYVMTDVLLSTQGSTVSGLILFD